MSCCHHANDVGRPPQCADLGGNGFWRKVICILNRDADSALFVSGSGRAELVGEILDEQAVPILEKNTQIAHWLGALNTGSNGALGVKADALSSIQNTLGRRGTHLVPSIQNTVYCCDTHPGSLSQVRYCWPLQKSPSNHECAKMMSFEE